MNLFNDNELGIFTDVRFWSLTMFEKFHILLEKYDILSAYKSRSPAY